MKPYTVTWGRDAEEELARLYMDNPAIRSEIATASNEIDRILATTPHALGYPTVFPCRQAIVYPLAVLFSVSDEDRRAHVIYVKYWTD